MNRTRTSQRLSPALLKPALLTPALATLALVATASAQTTVVSTRTFNAEAVDFSAGFANSGGQFDFQLGPEGVSPANGTPVLVEIDLSVTWDIDLDVTNDQPFAASLSYQTPVDMISNLGDCAAYDFEYISAFASNVPAGGVGNLVIDSTSPFAWTGSTFNIACSGSWDWSSVSLWTSILDSFPRISGAFGGGVPAHLVQVNSARGIITGEVKVTWEADPLPFQVVCPGSAATTVNLESYGGFAGPFVEADVYLVQPNAPMSTNLMVQGSMANSVVQPSGLCLTAGITRVPGGVTQGGAQLRLPTTSALSGSVTYFQSWFRTPGVGTSSTSECIEITFP